MKLHLPHKFQAALMAALGAVAFPVLGTGTIAVATGACLLAGQQAQAEEITRSETWDIPRSGTTVTGEALSLTGISCTTTQMNDGAVASNDVFAPNTNVGNGNTWTLTFTIKNETNHEVTLDSLLLDVSMFNSSGNAQNTSTVRTVKFTLSQNGTALDSFDNILQGKGNVTTPVCVNDSTDKPLLTFADGVQLAANSSKQFTLKVERGSNQTAEYRNGCYYGLIDMVANYSYEIAPCVWSGAGGHTTWTDSSAWTGGAPTAETPVVFNASGSTTTVTIGSSVAAASVAVSDKAYTFSGNGTLTTGSLTIADGASLALTNGTTLAVSGDVTLSGSAALSLASGTTLKLSSGGSANALEYISGNGDVHIADTMLFAGSSTESAPATTRATGALIVDQGKTLKIGTDDTGRYQHTYVNMESFGKVQLNGSTLWVHNDEFTLRNLETTTNGGTVTIHDSAGQDYNTLTLAGTTTLNGNLTFNGAWKQQFTIEKLAGEGALILAGTDFDKQIVNIGGGTVGSLQINKSNVEANITGDLTVGGMSGTAGSVHALQNLTINATSNASYTGTLAIDGTLTKTGTGKQTLSGFAINNTINLQRGTLELTGAYNLDNLQLSGGTVSYVNGQGIAQGSGFKKVTNGTLDVVNRTTGGVATLTLTGATFTYNGAEVTVDTRSGDATVNSEDYTTLWVNGTGSVSYNAAENIATQHTATVGTVRLNAEGATITMDKAAAAIDLVMTSGISGTVHATAATTLSSITGWEKTLTISGTETVTLPSGDIQLTGTQKLAVEGKAATGKLILNSAEAELAVAKNGELAVTGNLTPTHGTVNINGTVNISSDLDLSNGDKSDATMVIGGTGRVTAAGMWMCSTSTLKLQEGGQYTLGNLTFTGKGDDTSIAANDNTKYGEANAKFTITHAQVTANGSSSIKNKLVNTSVVAGSHTVAVENAGNTIAGASVSEGGSFTMTSGTLTDVVTSTGGTVALSGITLGDSFEQQGGAATYVDLKGAEVTASDNYYLGNTKGYVTVVTGTGEFSGSDISWGGKTYSLETDGTITTKEAGTDYTTFYINKDSVQVTDILAHVETQNVQVNAGTLDVNGDASGLTITVTAEGTITGEKADAKQVDIQKDAVAHYTGNVEDSAVKFTAEQGKTVDITNKGDESHKYSIGDAGMHVAAQKMELSAAATGDVVVNNHVSVETVENLSTHTLTLNDGKSEVENVFATHGDIKFYNTGDAIALVSMTIGEGKQVGAYTGIDETSTNEATVSISHMLTAGKNASLYADLVLESNSTLNLGGHSMYLGSQLTLQEGLIQFDDATLKAIAALDMHQTLYLFQAADDTQLSYSGVSNEDWARTHFDLSSITDADYKIVANDNVFGIEKVSNVPEPATGTLSLLALAALAARRRRKG